MVLYIIVFIVGSAIGAVYSEPILKVLQVLKEPALKVWQKIKELVLKAIEKIKSLKK